MSLITLLSSTSFTPASLFASGEQGVWYDPSDLTTLFTDVAGTTRVTAAGDAVARINDKSGRGNHATQATLAARPFYRIDAGGRPYLEFDGIDDFMATATVTPGANKAQIFAGALRHNAYSGTSLVAELGPVTNSTNGSVAAFSSTGFVPDVAITSRGTAYEFLITGNVLTTNVPYIHAGLTDIAGQFLANRVNGALVNSSSAKNQGAGNYLANPIYIGSRAGTGSFYNGRIYGLIMRFSSANLGAAQISSAERWLARKAGVVLP